MKKLFIEQRVKEHEEATNNIVEEIAKAIEKITTASTEQGKLLKLITEEILTLKTKVDNLENKHTHA